MLHGCVQAAQLCRGSPVIIVQWCISVAGLQGHLGFHLEWHSQWFISLDPLIIKPEGKSTLIWQHQAITLAHADPDLCRHMASLGCNESMICCVMVTPQFLSYKIRSIIKRTLIYSWSLSNETYIHTSVCSHWASSARLFSIYHSQSLLMISKLINTRRSELFLKSVLKQWSTFNCVKEQL